MTLVFKSSMPVATWRGDVTTYPSQRATRPNGEHVGLTIGALFELIAPIAGPHLTADKTHAPYCTPGLLKDAPFIGKTLDAAKASGQPTIGKQRSGQHVTESTFLFFDVDDASPEQVKAMGCALTKDCILSLIYTTFSHGAEDKPGWRIRVLVPVDGPLDSASYHRAWAGANQQWFDGLADPTGAKLSQAQGLWATHPDRKNKASRRVIEGGIASLDALLAKVLPPVIQRSRIAPTGKLNPVLRAQQIEQITRALPLQDADYYSAWTRTINCLKALAPQLGEDEMQALAVTFSQQGDIRSTLRNDDPRYDPERFFGSTCPTMSPDAAAGTLFRQARDKAAKILKQYLTAKRQNKSTRDVDYIERAAQYLSRYHPKHYEQIKQGEV